VIARIANGKGMRSLNIAMIGSKGLPAKFGGVERHVEEVGKRLANRGHRVTVYGRKPLSAEGEYCGMRIKILPSISTKNLDTATNTLAATFHALFGGFDIIHYHAIGPSIFSWLPALAGKPTIATIHAPDYRQAKWGRTARALLRLGERTAVRRATAAISVSRLMAEQLQERYGRKVHYIPNGATIREAPPFEEARELGLEEGRYILTVGRFIVERSFHTLLEAFRDIETDHRLVIVGDARFEDDYASSLKALADDRVLFPGYIYGNLLSELYAHCAFYVLPSTVEGLPISLIEAMSFSRPVLVSDIPENLEVAGGIGATFRAGDAGDLARSLRMLLDLGDDALTEMGVLGLEKVGREYTWDSVTDRLEGLYLDCASDHR
jgi:glycosyltransferase involved in cell wall biosynthesis